MERFVWHFVAVLLSAGAVAGEVSHEPMLKIESGMHSSRIDEISVDSAGRRIVSGSADKTVRIWDADTGRLLRTIHIPGGDGFEGQIYATAVSPDGKLIAASGWTTGGTSAACIYVFETDSGRLRKRIAGLPDTVKHLMFSPAGEWLAATCGSGGVRLFRGGDLLPAGADNSYDAPSYGAAFDHSGHMATTSFDGLVRLYRLPSASSPFELADSIKVAGKPYSLAFTPDGARLAVTFLQSPEVALLSTPNLTQLLRAGAGDLAGSDCSTLAWSIDGRTLFAGGVKYRATGKPLIRAWARGMNSHHDLRPGEGIVTSIAALPSGGLAFASTEPAIGTFAASGRRQLWIPRRVLDPHRSSVPVRISPDARIVQLAANPTGDEGLTFDLSQRALTLRGPAGIDLHSAQTTVADLAVGGVGGLSPTLEGRPLRIDEDERTHSLAIERAGSWFLMGAEWHLYRFDAHGEQVWAVRMPDIVWDVCLSDDGAIAVVVLGDGTVRWYRTSDGTELLALLPAADHQRWILWTPHGYYDCSPGAEDLIGWQINATNGVDFYPASRFRTTFYRPEMVPRVLEAADERAALEGSEKYSKVENRLPPVVEITSPLYGAFVNTTNVTIRFRIHTPTDAPVTSVFALVNGRPPMTSRGVGVLKTGDDAGSTSELTVAIPPRDSEISIIAENRNGAGAAQTIQLRWIGEGDSLPAGQHKLFVLSIGVSNYPNELLRLPLAAKDAADIATAFGRQNRSALYGEVVVHLLTNQAATRAGILEGFDWLKRQARSEDVAVIFISGHGNNDQSGEFLFIPYDVDLHDLPNSCVTSKDVQDIMRGLAARPVIFIDACYSGSVMRRAKADVNRFALELESPENGAIVITAATGKQQAFENPAWRNGAFTKALLEALRGEADYFHKGRITVNGLLLYISSRVAALTRSRQTPAFAMPQTIADFALANVVK